MITQAQLSKILPNNRETAEWTPVLNQTMEEFDIVRNLDRIAAFVAQIAHESAELTRVRESLKYTKAETICRTWPKRFPTPADAEPYVSTTGVANGRDRALANRVYNGKLGNVPGSDDGWTFRGRGLIQITGRSNYREVGEALGLPGLEQQPELLEQKTQAARSAGYFWKSRGLNALADDFSDDNDDADFEKITIAINGATKGLAERRAYWIKARQTLGLSVIRS
ncbi:MULTISPECIES: glycoside hydrolase family 19 protein [Hydrocarboniphaga]|jgi:putative chitinase|uniref:Glycoside hydrolase family 19 catalytic domain-containing protein n=1 Tax=Hydrocarboniphaga effusa AP103 TaxID=1172194 RepID=I8TCP5_9GAMM|nr:MULTISPECIES: glycoside hydrolase family 19 protein [Hydrocarboniphaga]EIT71730.1 hypothetical protein WQQ_18670 [Hydrocarboniphaga effusa AP103]MDZ4080354.1 glycoside hydrolase family 19 protein [Hydrocarboniphaga sp.]